MQRSWREWELGGQGKEGEKLGNTVTMKHTVVTLENFLLH